ncbi:mannose/fructose/sorbose PTS transporter subunit IIA [Vagococcus sp.]|uniref:mannose/fructose/sorbose PTS transporter subunit IIA n=1 Tax=Vagococcus sp. TaxID=1933889 RepID=UPI003F989966
MVGIILASHGEFAEGIMQSGTMIFGEQENVQAITLMPSEGPEDVKRKIETAIQSFENQEEILFLVDLWGGTPFNQANTLFEEHKEQWAIVSGLNLPMLIEAYASRLSMNSAQEIAAHVLETAREGVKVRPEALEKVSPVKKEKNVQTSALPTKGKMEVVLTRIDSRLLHGQVATAWTKTTNPTRIIVVSDNVAKDELRKTLITQASPPGVKANVIPIDKLAEIWDDPRFGKTKALLLFENPEDVARAVDLGVELKKVNVGSMAHSEGKVMVNNVLSVNKTDIQAFEHLKEKGITFDVRKVPNDSSKNLWELLKKANLAK